MGVRNNWGPIASRSPFVPEPPTQSNNLVDTCRAYFSTLKF